MRVEDIARRRLANQGITVPRFESPEAVVGWLGAVQAQEYNAAKWSLGQRAVRETDATVERALNDGRILRTHVLRPTWHFVLPSDIRWLVELTAPQIRRRMASYDRLLEVDEALRELSYGLIEHALASRGPLTRSEVAQVLSAGGIDASGQRLAHFMFHAELSCLVCSGPRKGKQQTYALFAERAQDAHSMPREQALAELARRFFSSHGPATAKDFSTWSGLTLTDARRGIEVLGAEVRSFEVDGRVYLQAVEQAEPAADAPRAHLLQTFDEYVSGYSESRDVLGGFKPGALPAGRPLFSHPVLLDGRLVGHWRRTLKSRAMIIDMRFYRPLEPLEAEAVREAIGRYGDFTGLPASPGALESNEA